MFKFKIDNLSFEERQALKKSLLGKRIKVVIFDDYGMFTEHGFPVAVSFFTDKDVTDLPKEFYADVIKTDPMVTIDDFPK